MTRRELSVTRIVLGSAVAMLIGISSAHAVNEQVSSPDGTITVNVAIEQDLEWSLSVDGKEILPPAPVAMKLRNGSTLGQKPRLRDVRHDAIDEMIEPPVAEKRRQPA